MNSKERNRKEKSWMRCVFHSDCRETLWSSCCSKQVRCGKSTQVLAHQFYPCSPAPLCDRRPGLSWLQFAVLRLIFIWNIHLSLRVSPYRLLNLSSKAFSFTLKKHRAIVRDLRQWQKGSYLWKRKFVVGSLLCSERFFSGYSGFSVSSKTNISKFQFD